MPTLKQRVTEVLKRAGFTGREDHLPLYDCGGTFEIVAGVGAEVRVQWWDSSPEERRELLERFAVALREAGIKVEDRGEALYVARDLKAQRGRRGGTPYRAA